MASPIEPFRRDALTILLLALAPAVGLGISRFAYALVLPDMRASLGWTYAQAGLMNGLNAAGYLLGAILAAAILRRASAYRTIVAGAALAVLSLVLSALTANYDLLAAARVIGGFGAALTLVAGGVLASELAQRHPEKSAFLLALFYTGPGIGILLSGLLTPILIERFGPGSWPFAWGALAALSAALTVCLAFVHPQHRAARTLATTQQTAPLRPMLPLLLSYGMFGAGYIGYMTFMIAWIDGHGADAAMATAFWSILGLGVISAPWLWSGIVARLHGGRAVAVLTSITAASALLPLEALSRPALFLSAFVFGGAFMTVVTGTTAFVRKNYAPAQWASGIGAMTVAFSLGQTLGPVASGALTDRLGSLEAGLLASVGLLLAGALIALWQRDLPVV